MNIDRDDEYATRYEAAPTIEEQIEYCRDVKEKMQRMSIGDPMNDAILASLQKLAALDSQPVTVEPATLAWIVGDGYPVVNDPTTSENAHMVTKLISRTDYDSLKSALQRVTEERDALSTTSAAQLSASYKRRAEAAESLNKRMVELLKEPSEGMIAAGYPPNDERAQSWGVTEVFKAMSAELLKEVEK